MINIKKNIDLPSSIIYFKLSCNNSYIINYLPNSIEEIILFKKFKIR